MTFDSVTRSMARLEYRRESAPLSNGAANRDRDVRKLRRCIGQQLEGSNVSQFWGDPAGSFLERTANSNARLPNPLAHVLRFDVLRYQSVAEEHDRANSMWIDTRGFDINGRRPSLVPSGRCCRFDQPE